jgi:ankyrin repeat protein
MSNPIQWAVVKGNLDCVKHLVDKGAKTDILSRDNETLLDIANKKANEDLINYVKKFIMKISN